MSEEGELVGRGAFLVDRRKALDKLMKFQLPNPAGFGLVLLRCAAASGATYFNSRWENGHLLFEFDGRPFPAAELRDPYRPLFEDHTALLERNRLLAIGLLSALRYQPKKILVRSGRALQRASLVVSSIEKEELVDGGGLGGDHTVIAVETSVPIPEVSKLLLECTALTTLHLSIDGKNLAPWRERAPAGALAFEDPGSRGWVAPPDGELRHSTIDLFVRGALVERVTVKLPVAQVRAALNHDGFALNASQSGVVRDEPFKQALLRLQAPAQELVLRCAATLAATMNSVGGRLVDPALRRRWAEVLELGRKRDMDALGAIVQGASRLVLSMRLSEPRSAELQEIEGVARSARWLRQIAAERKAKWRLKGGPLDEALRACPLFIGADGLPLSVNELEKQHAAVGYLPYSRELGTGLPLRALWTVLPGEENTAEALIGGPARDVTALVSRQHWLGRGPTFEAAGLPAPLIRAEFSVEDALAGEVGLSSAPAPKARVHLLTDGVPSGLVESEEALRFEAVATDPSRRLDGPHLTPADKELCAAALRAARAAALPLYRRLAEEFDSMDHTAQGAARRAHLFDALALLLERGGLEEASKQEHAWLARAPLFAIQRDASLERLDWLELARPGSEPFYLARNPQEQGWCAGKRVVFAAGLEDARLSRVFPAHVAGELRERPGVVILARSAGDCPECRGKTGLAFRAGGQTYHAAAPANGLFAWDEAALHPAPWSAVGSSMAGHPEAALELLAAALRQDGATPDPAVPMRALAIRLLGEAPPPWPGRLGRKVWDALRGKAFFRAPNGIGRSLEDVFAALHSAGGRLTYVMEDKDESADLLLDADELSALRKLEPLGAQRLVPFGAASARPRLSAAEASPDEREPAPSTFLSVFRGKALIKPHERFLLERRYQAHGLDVWIGLPARLPAPDPDFVARGGAPFELGSLPPIAWILVDAKDWPEAPRKAGPAVLMELLRGFYEELADRWPPARPGTEWFDVAQRYVLEAALRADKDRALFAGWDAVRRRLQSLKLFRCSDGAFTSLDELRDSCKPDGVLRYADPEEPTRSVDAPLLPNPKLVAQLLGVQKLKKLKDAPLPAPAPPSQGFGVPALPASAEAGAAAPPPTTGRVLLEPSTPAPREKEGPPPPPAVALAHKLLLGLRGRKGLPRHEASALKLGTELPDSPISIGAKGEWVLDARHPLVVAILESTLPANEQAAYLASVAYTAANRLKHKVSDDDDIRFQDALSSALQP